MGAAIGSVFGALGGASAVATGAAIVGAGATLYSANQQRQAAKAQVRQQQEQARRSQRQAIREAQIRRAQALSTAQAAGAIEGSAVSGGLASLGAQTGEALGFGSMMSGLSRQISVASSRAQTAGAIAGLAFTGFDIARGMGRGTQGPTESQLLGGI